MNDRKVQVLQTAKGLFIEKGFQATSIQDILDSAHISKGTFYNYFSSKNECMMAILRGAYHASFLRRNEMAIGKDLRDPQLLADQIEARLSMNREQNLLPLFETVVHSPDSELREFVRQMHFRELAWIAKRLVDIYGEQVKPYAFDCASLIFGFLQHSLNIWKSSSSVRVNTKELVDFTMQRMKVVVPDMIEHDARFMSDELLTQIMAGAEIYPMTREVLTGRLKEFTGGLPESHTGRLYGEFLLEELAVDRPRGYLLESVLRSFRQSFEKDALQLQAVELSAALWLYIDKTEC